MKLCCLSASVFQNGDSHGLVTGHGPVRVRVDVYESVYMCACVCVYVCVYMGVGGFVSACV